MILDFFGQFATKDQVAIDRKSNFTNFNDYTYECMEFVNLSNITGEKPVNSGIALFISKKGDISTSFSGYLQLLITRDGRVFGRQIYGRNGTITNYGAWVDFYSKTIEQLYNPVVNVDDLIENLNDCVQGRTYKFDATMANIPVSGSGVVTTFGGGDVIYQVAYTKASPPVKYMRTKFDYGSWSSWSAV